MYSGSKNATIESFVEYASRTFPDLRCAGKLGKVRDAYPTVDFALILAGQRAGKVIIGKSRGTRYLQGTV
jgi:hypothetical protein